MPIDKRIQRIKDHKQRPDTIKVLDKEGKTMSGKDIDTEFEELKKRVMDKVIPRLLRQLETGGRSITPCLVHGDLWDGNASVNVDTGKSTIFDGTPLYAHNECES